MASLKLNNALTGFFRADTAIIDCGPFDVEIKQAANHNDSFRAATTARMLGNNNKRAVASGRSASLSAGDYADDVELFIDELFVGWGPRPMKDDSGKDVPTDKETLRSIFMSGKAGKVFFNKLQAAALSDDVFKVTDEDLGN